MTRLSRWLLASLFLAGSLMTHAASRPAKPNIIVILADDQGYQDLGCQGAVDIQTPRIDRMAKEGIRLTSFYAGATCSPSRAALMTGRYPQRYGIRSPINNPTGGLPLREVTIAKLLKQQGYATGLIGKWHLGLSKEMSPIAHGFDYYSGVPLSQISRHPRAHATYYKRQWRIQDAQGRYEVEYNPNEEQFTQRCTKEALAFIERNKDQPFFLYLAELMVHTEVVASPEFDGKTKRGVYGDACQELDWSAGQVLDQLSKLGLDERTLVVYASDNGATVERNYKVSETSLGSNLPLKGHKYQLWEGGSRVPCIIRWPGQIPAGRVSSELAGMVDLLPTFAYLAGATPPEDRPIDGLNLWPFLHGDSAASPHRVHSYYGNVDTNSAVRVGPWKLVGSKELFNLQTDLSETKDVAGEHPDLVEQLGAFQAEVTAALKADKPLPPPPFPKTTSP